jgi:opacity protein-like surface antigen
MRKMILGAASALALASPVAAADLPVQPRFTEVPSYGPEVQTYQYRLAPPVVIAEPAPLVSETFVVRRPVIVAPPRAVYPVYAAQRFYAAPHAYAYAAPVWVTDGALDVTSAAIGNLGRRVPQQPRCPVQAR